MTSCSFCHKTEKQVKKIIVNEKVGICNNCIELCSHIIKNDFAKKDIVNIDPVELKNHLDKFIVSQDNAKIILSVAVANHFKRLKSPQKIDKSNVMLLGPTGSGKTLLAKTIASYLNIPIVIVDATTLTESGYVGDDVDSILVRLLQAANGDVSLAEQGIVFIDEIDKIAKKDHDSSKKEPGGEGVQQSLLKLVEGSTIKVPLGKDDEYIDVSTDNILFIASGAFTGLAKIKKNRKSSALIGFTADVTNKENYEASLQDIIEFGMIPEFAGRFPIIAEVADLTHLDMLNILSKVENNLVSQYKTLFKYSEVNLSFDKAALDQVVNIALKQKTGARSLRSVMEQILLPHMYNINSYSKSDNRKLRITKNLITNPKEVKKS